MPELIEHAHDHAAHAATSDPSVWAFFSRLFSTDFVPRGDCVAWRPEIIWLHVASDAMIALSYYSIPLALIYFIRKRADLAYKWMFAMFAVFILACGTTHVISMIAFWHPMYRLDGVTKAVTAIASIITASMLWPLIPRAAALPSPAQLRSANADLEREIVVRREAEEQLRRAHAEMEDRVRERTSELARLNDELHTEIAHRRTEERHKSFLLAELDHRVKNTLAMVLSLSEESLRTSRSMQEFSMAFSGRVRALARTHSALAAANWDGVSLQELVSSAVQACRVPTPSDPDNANRVAIGGPEIRLSSKAATTICLTLNELATNACKYGALSTSKGRVQIQWRIEPATTTHPPMLHLHWEESDGPRVTPPARRGLGSTLIEEGAAYELGGRVKIEYPPEGLRCSLEFAMTPLTTEKGRFESAATDGPDVWSGGVESRDGVRTATRTPGHGDHT